MIKKLKEMRFNIDGGDSRGYGWISFCTYPINQLIDLFPHKNAFVLYHYILIEFISRQHWLCEEIEYIEINLKEVCDFLEIGNFEFDVALSSLLNLGFIECDKFEKKNIWRVKVFAKPHQSIGKNEEEKESC